MCVLIKKWTNVSSHASIEYVPHALPCWQNVHFAAKTLNRFLELKKIFIFIFKQKSKDFAHRTTLLLLLLYLRQFELLQGNITPICCDMDYSLLESWDKNVLVDLLELNQFLFFVGILSVTCYQWNFCFVIAIVNNDSF
jgi:hypothetical protein